VIIEFPDLPPPESGIDVVEYYVRAGRIDGKWSFSYARFSGGSSLESDVCDDVFRVDPSTSIDRQKVHRADQRWLLFIVAISLFVIVSTLAANGFQGRMAGTSPLDRSAAIDCLSDTPPIKVAGLHRPILTGAAPRIISSPNRSEDVHER
jgi:hypothetical protein